MNEEQTPATIPETEGVVKWFDPKKGYGFIIGPQGQDIFVHYTKIEGEGFRVLKDGSSVVYEATLTEKGWHATRVRRTGGPEVTIPPRHRHARSPRR
jgi:CspA family cold shock protein